MNFRKQLRFCLSSLNYLFCGFLVPFSSHASEIITGTATDNMDSTWTYEYTIDNTSGTFDVFAFHLHFDFVADSITGESVVGGFNFFDTGFGGDVSVPLPAFPESPTNLWTSSAVFNPDTLEFDTLEFLNLDLFGFGDGDVLMGQSLSGFSFTSILEPTTVSWDVFDPLGLYSSSGTVIGPGVEAVVPEAASTGVLTALFVFTALLLFKRKR